MSRFQTAYMSHALPQDTSDVQISCSLHYLRTGQMSRFPIAYTSHALPQDRADVQISCSLHVTCTAPGQGKRPDFRSLRVTCTAPRTGQMSRFPVADTSPALPQDRADVQISCSLHITCTAPGQGRCPGFL